MVRLLFAGCKANVNYEQKFYNYKGKRYEGEIFIEKDADSTWNLLLQIATDDGLGSVIYTSDDEWKTWNRKEK